MKKRIVIIISVFVATILMIGFVLYTNIPTNPIYNVIGEDVEEIMLSVSGDYYYVTEPEDINEIILQLHEMKLYKRLYNPNVDGFSYMLDIKLTSEETISMYNISEEKLVINGKLYDMSENDVGILEVLYNRFSKKYTIN